MTIERQRYHSELKAEYVRGKLSPDIVKTIPRSTRQRWREKEKKSFWMPVPIEHNVSDGLKIRKLVAENKRLKAKVRALYYLVMLYKEIVALLPLKASHVLKVRKAVQLLLRFCWHNKFDKNIWRFLPFSFRQWHSWEGLKSCLSSFQGYCRKQNVKQLSVREQVGLENGCTQKEFKNWPLISIYYHLLRQNKISCSIAVFYKYCRLLKITRRKHKTRKKYIPIVATAPLQILHQDITIFKTRDGVKQYVYLIKDNFSRAILGFRATTEYSSELARQTFHQVLQNFGLMEKEGTLITDGGSENKGALDDMLAKPGMLWKRLTAQLDIIQSNNMIEATNRILKYRYLYPKIISTGRELTEALEKAITDYNAMPSGQLFGLTPNEVLNGAIPTRGIYKEQINSAIMERIQENRAYNCSLHCHSENT